MSDPFISDDKTRVVHPADEKKPEEQQRFITIRAKMDFGARARLNNLAIKTEKQEGACSTDQYHLFLLEVNVLSWGGPGYIGVAVTPQNIHRLNPNDPLTVAAVEKIIEVNVPEESPDPKLAAGSASSDDGSMS